MTGGWWTRLSDRATRLLTGEDAAAGERRRGLRRDAAGLMNVLDNAPLGVLAADSDGRLSFINNTLARWMGKTPGELINEQTRLHDLFIAPPPDACCRSARPFDLIANGGDRQQIKTQLRRADGAPLPVAVDLDIVRDAEGGFIAARAVLRDVTQETAARAGLEQANDRLRRLFQDAPVGIALLDCDGRFVECNHTLAELAGRPADSLTDGATLTELVEPRDRPALLRGLSGGGDGKPLEVRLKGASPKVAQVFIRRLRGGDESGRADTLVHLIDLTERRSLEAQFVQSQKMQAVGQLAGGVAHDFNNLLTAMIGFCDLLLLRHKPGDHSFSDVMQIKQNANRAANLVRQLLAFSRQQTLQPRVLDVADVLAELANLLRRLIGETIELRLEHGRDLWLVKVDLNQLEQVIVNLAVNARDAMTGGGRLTLATGNEVIECALPAANQQDEIAPGEYVRIDVADTGVGIPPENLARIFEPFFSTKEIGAGTGLGLSTVYGIVRQTGGFVTVDSAPGAGARFTILLPRCRDEAPTPQSDEARDGVSADLTGAATVLLVEDEDAVRVFSARALRNKGYQVMEAKNGEAALATLTDAGGEIDLLITDVVMPQMDGPTLARKTREFLPDLKVIFISGYAEDRVREDLGGVEGAHFLPKPFSLKQLAAKVKDVLRRG
jgi:two-component system, cell cycle sensor histidine kinase and response regulator CckA